MHLALLSEFGARSIYDHLRRWVRDEEMARMLTRLNEAGAESVERLRQVMIGMGATPRRTSFRRRALARMLATMSRATGPRPVLRVCHNAEETVSRWYAQYAIFLTRLGDYERARELETLRRTKILHAQVLAAFINLARNR